jgi:hypothetical protein
VSDDPKDLGIILVGLVTMAIAVLLLAYAHEAAAECLRKAVEDGQHFWEMPSTLERIVIGSLAAVVLYGVLCVLHLIFQVFRKPYWGIGVVIAGAALAGWIPPDEFLPELCHFL